MKSPFFLNFDGKSALNIAIEARDFASFSILLAQFVRYQNRPESALVVDNWLPEAIEKGVKLDGLFKSKVLTQVIKTGALFPHSGQFEHNHSDLSTFSVEYPHSFSQLQQDKNVYSKFFESRLSKKVVQKQEQTQPIRYAVDHVFESSA
jgi:hypothetical protein